MADKSLYSKHQVDNLLEMAFDAMVMLLGQDDLIAIKNVERFKRDIRVSCKYYFYDDIACFWCKQIAHFRKVIWALERQWELQKHNSLTSLKLPGQGPI